MERKFKEYSKPRMVKEKFVPQEFVALCAEASIPGYSSGNKTYAYLDWNNPGTYDSNEQGKINHGSFQFTEKYGILPGGIEVSNVKIGNGTYDGKIYTGVNLYYYLGSSVPLGMSQGMSYSNTNYFAFVGTYTIFKRNGSEANVYFVTGYDGSGTGTSETVTTNHS